MAERAFTPLHPINVEDLRLNYDPESPQKRFKAAGVEGALLSESERLPSMVPWPAATKPTPAPLPKAPPESADLSQFKGYDAVVVTWTSAEAAALAALFTPGFQVSQWYEYRYDVQSYIPLVTGDMAPFNDKTADMARYYHSLGLYFPIRIGKASVLLMKSGLHLDYDGPAYPVRKMITEVVQTVQPKLFITTGTGGGIGYPRTDPAAGRVRLHERRAGYGSEADGEGWPGGARINGGRHAPGRAVVAAAASLHLFQATLRAGD